MRKSLVMIGLAALVLLCCCNNPTLQHGVQLFKDLGALQEKIAAEFSIPAGQVGVKIMNGRALTISLVNSSYNDQPKEKRREKAREIARFVKANYPDIEKIERIGVVFSVHQRIMFIIKYHNDTDFYSFKTAELDLPEAEGR